MKRGLSFRAISALWTGNPSYRLLSAHARGVWFEAAVIAAQAVPTGALVLGGKVLGAGDLARQTGIPRRQVNRGWGELRESGALLEIAGDPEAFLRRLGRTELSWLRRPCGKTCGFPVGGLWVQAEGLAAGWGLSVEVLVKNGTQKWNRKVTESPYLREVVLAHQNLRKWQQIGGLGGRPSTSEDAQRG